MLNKPVTLQENLPCVLHLPYFKKSNLLILFLFIFTLSFSQKTYYIDPGFSGATRNGSVSSPFNSLTDFQWENGSMYLIKSSTVLPTSGCITIAADNVVLGSYGSGQRPIIQSSVPKDTRTLVIRGAYVKVMNLDIRAPKRDVDNTAGTVVDMIGARSPVLDNVKTTGGYKGINASKTTGTAKILNCHVTDTWDDGMYHRTNDTVIIENTRVERVNLKYHINPAQTYAGGDCIQFDYVTHFEIRNCTLDKSFTGGKFCLIADHFDTGITEGSTLIGVSDQHGVYLGIGNFFSYRYNTLSGCQYGVWNKTMKTEIYYNIFKNTALAAYYGESQLSSVVYNNLFVSCGEAVRGYNEQMKVNNNIFSNNVKNIIGNFSKISADYNCYFPGNPDKSEVHSFTSDPKFISPSNGNFQLAAGSPCIDKGIASAGLIRDVLKNSVPYGNTPDIGPYEFGSSTQATNNPPQIKYAASSGLIGGKVAFIDASLSNDPEKDSLSYSWTTTSGANIKTPKASKIEFLVPDVIQNTDLTFNLNISDGKLNTTKEIVLQATPYHPELGQITCSKAAGSEYEEPNSPACIIDGNPVTRWSANGDNSWLTVELDALSNLSFVKLAYFHGSFRTGYFDLLASGDNKTWDLILDHAQTSGLCEGCQVFDIPEPFKTSSYKYLKLVGHSNSENSWNSFTEMKVYGKAVNLAPVIKYTSPAEAFGGKIVTLDASQSTDPNGKNFTFSWKSNDGIQLSSPSSSKTMFLAPDAGTDKNLSFVLTLDNGTNQSSSEINILVKPYNPELKTLQVSSATASSFQEPNAPANAVDNNFSTRWSAEGDNSWLELELNSPANLSFFKIAFSNGHYRQGKFEVMASADKTNWVSLLTNSSTCGLSEGCEIFDVPESQKGTIFRFIKLIGHANSENAWNSYLEFSAHGRVVEPGIPLPDMKTYYIDPSFTGQTRDGSLNLPFNSLADFQWEDHTAYLLKSSSTLTTANCIVISANNVLFGSYGNGERPIIKSEVPKGSRVLVVKGENNKVMNLDLRAPQRDVNNSAGCVLDMIEAKNPVIENCKTTGGEKGINASKTTGKALILNCHVTDTWDDGMYHRTNDTVIIENTLVERVNLKYHINPDQSYAGGDCIQFDYVGHFEIINCVLDKTYTGGKFCLIADHFDTGIAEHSNFKGSENQHGVFIGIGNEFTYRYNHLSGCQNGLWNHTANIDMYYNVFKNTKLSSYLGGGNTQSKIYNNLFQDCGEAVLAWSEDIDLKNNIFYRNTRNITGNSARIIADYNCYYPSKTLFAEPHSMNLDPKIIGFSDHDLQLDTNSPCIDAGISIEGLKTDLMNCSVPYGTKTDIGPCELASPSNPVQPTQGKKSGAAGSNGYLSIQNPFAFGTFNMYPNPSIDVLNLDFSAISHKPVKRVVIISMGGTLVFDEVYNNNPETIIIPHQLMDGIYVVRVMFYGADPLSNKLVVRTR